MGRILTESSGWYYSEKMVVGAGTLHHAGCYLAVEIPLLLKTFSGNVEIAKLNGQGEIYFDAKNGLYICSKEVQPGDIVRFRFQHPGRKANSCVKHLTDLICKDSV